MVDCQSFFVIDNRLKKLNTAILNVLYKIILKMINNRNKK
jgi:hypothetical protein